MKIFTCHVRPGKAPVLVPEGFSVLAALFGWAWLLVHRAWIPAALLFSVSIFVGAGARAIGSPVPILGLMLLQGLVCRDLHRWGLARRGYADAGVVAGADRGSALVRLLDAEPAWRPGTLPGTLPGTATP
jgi:hypothetical protein